MTVMSTSTETHLVANLKKYTKYEFFVAPFYRSVEGQPSNSKVVQTFEDGEYFSISGVGDRTCREMCLSEKGFKGNF